MPDDQTSKPTSIDELVNELTKQKTAPGQMPPTRPSTGPLSTPGLPKSPTPPMTKPNPLPSNLPMAPVSPPSKPFSPPMSPKPVFPASPPPVSTSSPRPLTPPAIKEYQSSIRTMSEDIAKLKQGQKPVGIEVPRKIEQVMPSGPEKPLPPKPLTPPLPTQQFKIPSVGLGPTEKSAPMAPTKPAPKPLMPPKQPSSVPSKPEIYVPPAGKKATNFIIFIGIAVVAVVAGFLYWWFVIRSTPAPVVIESPTPSPTETVTPTPTPKTLQDMFAGPAESLQLTGTGNPSAEFKQKTAAISINSGQLRRLSITTPDKGAVELTPLDLMDRFLVKYPAQLKQSLGTDGAILAHGQLVVKSTGPSTQNRIAFVQEIKDSQTVASVLQQWDPTMAADLASIFGYGKTKNVFVDDVYNGVSFRYIRIPDSNLGLAYATILGKYLVIASSKDSFRFIVDTLLSNQ